jgi:uncharacterized protein with HEPN domain
MNNRDIINKQIEYIEKILRYTKDADVKSFNENTMMLEACVFDLGQIGELVTKLDDDFKSAHQEVPWTKLTGLRHRIIHDYEGIIILLIWDIIENDLPGLREQLTEIIRG